MKYFSGIYAFLLAIAVFCLAACNNETKQGPYDDILTQPPYASLTDSIRKFPDRDELYFRRAVLLNKNYYPEPALADFKKAWSLKKEEQYALGAGTILLNQKPDSAISFLNDALKELPRSFLLQLTLARTFEAQKNISAALDVCENILRANPKQMDALVLKADLLDQQNKTGASIATLEKAYSINQGIEKIDYKLGYKYAFTKNPKTIAFCDNLLKEDSLNEHAEPLYFKGVYFEKTGDTNKALILFNEAIIRDYTFIDAYMNKGKILYDMKKYNDAIKTYRLLLNIQSTYSDAYYWLGKCQEAMGKKEEARVNYERAYGLDKTLTEAFDAANRLKN